MLKKFLAAILLAVLFVAPAEAYFRRGTGIVAGGGGGGGPVEPPPAGSIANRNSPIMMNFAGNTIYTTSYFCLDLFKCNSAQQTDHGTGFQLLWQTKLTAVSGDTGEEASLTLDSSGWPTQWPQPGITTADKVCTRFAPGSGDWPAGDYVVLYSGTGTLSFEIVGSGALTPVSSSAGRYVINPGVPSTNGITICIASSSSGDHVRDIHLVRAIYESQFLAGQIVNPDWVARQSDVRGYRYMDALGVNGQTTASWSTRSKITDMVWGQRDIPHEVIIGTLNYMGADGWVNVPINYADADITAMATLYHSTLNTTSVIYVELSNEVWNTFFSQINYARAQGMALWPNDINGNPSIDGLAGYNWYGLRTSQMCALWKTAWGADASRVKCVIGLAPDRNASGIYPPSTTNDWGNGYYDSAYNILNCPMAVHYGQAAHRCYMDADVAASSVYFENYAVPSAWGAAYSDGGLSELSTEVLSGGLLPSPVGAPVVSGGPSAYTVTSGHSVSCTPANGTAIAATFNTPTTGPATIAIDGCPPATLAQEGGLTSSYFVYGTVTLVYTTQICTSWQAPPNVCATTGSVTPAWRAMLAAYPGGMLAQTKFWYTQYATSIAASYSPLKYAAYEGGNNAFPAGQHDEISALYFAYMRSNYNYLEYANLLADWKANGGHIFVHYTDTSIYSGDFAWGALESIYQSPLPPKYNAIKDFIAANPCWWSNCAAGAP